MGAGEIGKAGPASFEVDRFARGAVEASNPGWWTRESSWAFQLSNSKRAQRPARSKRLWLKCKERRSSSVIGSDCACPD